MAAVPQVNPFPQGAKPRTRAAVPGSTGLRATGGSTNTTVSVTLDAETGRPHIVEQIIWSYSGTATTGRIVVSCGSDILFDVDVVAGGPQAITFEPPLACYAGSTTVISLYPVSGVTGKVNVYAYRLD